ncbi:MAG: HEAT repeat domain-containing protein [Verrucomicrobia bacterium]|nr:HEAT repeat domain-containing protein [Verrucomicrobiota bacterium]
MNTRSAHYVTFLVVVFAAMTPLCLRAYLVGSPDGLDKMSTNADIICKARAVSFAVITNEAFRPLHGFETRATKLEIVSILKGNFSTKFMLFQHYASNPQDRMGRMYSPQHYELDVGQCYLIFAVKTAHEGEFRQIRLSHTGKEDEGVLHTLDDRPLPDVSVKDAHWLELNLLLNDTSPTKQLYAIRQLSAMSKGCGRQWGHTDDFKREALLKVLLPLVTHANDKVAIAALNCFPAAPDCAAQIAPYEDALIQIANNASSVARRVTAIAAFTGTKFSVVSNALPQWLGDAAEDVRLQAVLLLPDFPGEFSEQALRERSADASAKVRAGVADAIGNGTIVSLLPTLKQLLSDPVGLTNPVPPLTTDQLHAGGRVWGGNNSDVHTAAGHALLKFDVQQVSDILKANLTDEGFRPNYLCKLAENDAGPWLTNLVEVLETRRIRVEKEVEASGVEPKAHYLQARMALSGTYFKCWNIIHKYLHALPATEFADGKMNRCLDALENAGDTGSREPTMLYELYRMKGLNKRAAKFRSDNEKRFAVYNINQFFDKVDAKYPNTRDIP